MGRRSSDKLVSPTAYPLPYGPRQLPQSARLSPNGGRQLKASGIDQRSQNWQRRLPVPGLISAYHALGNASLGGQLRLR